MGVEGGLGPAEAGEGEEAGGGPEGPRRRDGASQEGEAAAGADGGGAALVLEDGPRAVEPAAGLVRQLPSGLPPLPHLDVALPLDERLRHREDDNLGEASDRQEEVMIAT